MPDLGTFGTERVAVEPDTFGWFGSTVRTNPDMSDLAIVDFMEVAGAITADVVAASHAIKSFLRDCVHEDDFEAFWALGKANGQCAEDMMGVAKALTEAWTARPTLRLSASTGGPSPTNQTSAESVARRAYPGRPDLQVAVIRAAQARAS